MEKKPERFQSVITTSIHDVVLRGDMDTLINMLREDPLILDQCMIENAEYLKHSPLHIAARKGNIGVVKTLLAYEPKMCFTHDQYGRNPIHIASIHGHVEVLQGLIHASPEAAREQTNKGETFLQLYINHGHKEALMGLLNLVDGELLNAKDSKGNTVLHYAVRSKQHEMVKAILEDRRININAMNKDELTAMDTHMLLTESRKGHPRHKFCLENVINWQDDDEIGPILEQAKALTAEKALTIKHEVNWVESKSNGLMVGASLIATMAFTLAITPPGSSWQDPDPTKEVDYPPGVGIIYTNVKVKYTDPLLIANAIAFCSSLSVILLLISGLPNGRPLVVMLMVTMWIAVTATAVTYSISILLITYGLTKTSYRIPYVSIYIWAGLLGLVIISQLLKLVVKFIIRKPILPSWMIRFCKGVQGSAHHHCNIPYTIH